MTLRIDRSGRIVVPKSVRDRWGLRAGTDLEIEEGAGGLLLKPVAGRPSLVRDGRFLVHTGRLPAGLDILKAIADDREERLGKLAGR